ncbi:MAG: undecaprenyldiphospho-muramoylpentapeptide beta-N-acetylglucosaminyltransferase [Acidobacteria bacterium]|nr:undecaprenyldiphospho-muramoylpentapeptide beta-N-acetylglucosaminyltransferase [Acidobacteriota bacterium]
MRIIIAAGGTGGHIFPGIAVAREWVRRDPATEVMFVGTERGLESRLVPQAGFPLTLIQAGALKNVSIVKRLISLMKLPFGFWAVNRLFRQFRPDIVIGVGGYASGAAVMMAALKGIPTLVVEPNALPGFTNRMLARFTRAAAVTFGESIRFFPGKSVLTGNPVRAEFENLSPKPRTTKLHLLIFGGSQGAHAINQAMIDAAPLLTSVRNRLIITHQTGKVDGAEAQAAYKAASLEAEVCPFIDDMAGAFAQADLLICRAGATTVAEIAAAGKAALFIPFPLAADDHQRKNAEAFVNADAGRMILQSELNGERLAKEILSLIDKPERITAMEAASRNLARPNAAGQVVDLALRVASNSSFSELIALNP